MRNIRQYKIAFIIGTRPEAIKIAPVILEFKKSKKFSIVIILTGQHDDMIQPVMEIFKLKEDINFKVIHKAQNLADITSHLLKNLNIFLEKSNPSIVFVQGDTISALAGAISAFYKNIPVAHIEAGLRTNNLSAPFPEEGNRRMITQISTLHFAPTELASKNIFNNGIKKGVFITGNTVVDALSLKPFIDLDKKKYINLFKSNKKEYILVTIHRRENWGKPLENIANSLLNFSKKNLDINVFIPLHNNPLIKDTLCNILGQQNNIILTDHLPYLEFIYVLKNAKVVVTDSGGIQEEAVTLGKPLLILRDETERPEVLSEGNGLLVGKNPTNIESELNYLLSDDQKREMMSKKSNIFGEGKASHIILKKTLEYLNQSN